MKKLLFLLFSTTVSVMASILATNYLLNNFTSCDCDCDCDNSNVWPLD